MKTNNFILLILLFLIGNYSCTTQKYLAKKIDKWDDINIAELSLPIHKIDGKGKMVWATDYGDGTLYKSIDGGANWKKLFQFKSEYVEQIQFIDTKTGFVCGDYGYVYSTKDGGESWKEISPKIENRIVNRYRNDSTKNQNPDGLFVAYYGMHFNDTNTGIVSGYSFNPKEGFRKSFKRLLFETYNAGVSWNEVLKENKKEFINKYTEKVKPNFEEINGRYYFSKDIIASIEKDSDGNDLFRKEWLIDSIKKDVKLPKHNFKRGILRNIIFLNKKNGFIFGGSLDHENEIAIIYETKDGGRNWEYIESKLPHIHASKLIGKYLWLSGKKGLIKKKKVK